MSHDLHYTIDCLISSLSHRRHTRLSILYATRCLVSRSFPFLSDTHLSNRLLSLLSKLGSIEDTQKLFDQMPHRDICSYNTLISACSNAGQIDNARHLFDKMPRRDHFSWSTIISAYTRNSYPLEALTLYRQMFLTTQPCEISEVDNRFTVSSALVAATAVTCINYGKEIHGHVIRSGFQSDKVVWSALTDMYSKCGYMKYAWHVFDLVADRDLISWTTMMGRYFDNGLWVDGFQVFSDMVRDGFKPNEFTFTGLLHACSKLYLEETGEQVHCQMVKLGVWGPSSLFGESALVHMYSNCGSIDEARKMFDGMHEPDLVSWTSIITACAQNGLPEEALRYYDMMVQLRFIPDHVTFIGVLTACAHAGQVDKGRMVFNSIKEVYGMNQTSDHYACLVDLLCRSGQVDEAGDIIDNMPVKPNKFLWASLLSGARIHKNLKLGKRAAEALFEIEPDNPTTYVTLANMYSSAGLFHEVEKIWETMENKGLIKKPGWSS